MTIDLRTARHEDLPSILEIINNEIENTTTVYDITPRTLAQQKAWFIKKQHDKIPVIVAEKDGQIVGFGTYGPFRPWEAYKYSIEHSLYVIKEARGLGIGKQLFHRLKTGATFNGYHTMMAGIDAANKESISFHKNLGFEEVGRMNEVGYKFDRWLDLVFLQLILNAKKP